MKKEFNLSNKMIFLAPNGKKLFEYESDETIPLHISVEDVKEFVRLLKEKMPVKPSIFKMKMIELIDTLAGNKLIEEKK